MVQHQESSALDRSVSLDDEEIPEAERGLTDKEQSEVREAQRPRAPVVYEIIRLEGESELKRPIASLWWSGVAAGISIGFSFLSQAALAAGLPQSQWNHILTSLGYSVGFIIVILGRQQLFTENVLTAVLPVITRWKVSWFLRMLRLWGVVLAANVLGCFVFACAFALLPMLSDQVTGEMAKLVETLMRNSAWEMFAKGIGAGWLIASLVWILASVSSGQFLVIGLLTYLISLLQFTHIVAGTAEVLYGWLAGFLTFYDASVKFFLPTLAGNVFGGTILFSVLSYGQVREEIFEERTDYR
ncbi:MAG TPA: formate/nitrite transporter family protein [Geobacterales bacterium]|nr:formate/nitrite transporter family protein [Geobacterales bacterium]